jgi:hypothetical protein
MAATLATGGVLSHRAAAALWALRRSEAVEVTARAERLRKNVLVHRAPIPPDERTVRDGIPPRAPPAAPGDPAAAPRASSSSTAAVTATTATPSATQTRGRRMDDDPRGG